MLAVEWDAAAHATLEAAALSDRAVCGDVRDLELFAGLEGKVDLLWASPPCQAWSTAGKRLGAFDERNGWPWTLDIVDRIQPRWVLCENVLGMVNHQGDCQVVQGKVRTGEALDLFSDAVDAPQIGMPPPEDCPGCYWERVVLPEFRTRFPFVAWKVVNSANHGVPQMRQRVILLAGPEPIAWPAESHSLSALVYDKWVGGSYWTRHGVSPLVRTAPVEKSSAPRTKPTSAPWVTSRDVLSVLSPPAGGYDGLWVEPHQMARTVKFRGITDVAMNPDMPSDTVTCRRGGAKTNDALIWDDGGRLRYLTLPEVAALQAFPSAHPWQRSKSARCKQVGNAVPPPVAEALGRPIFAKLTGD